MGLPFSIPNPTKCKAQGLTDVPSLTISLSKRALTNTHPLVHRDGSKLGRAVRWVKTFLVILDWEGGGVFKGFRLWYFVPERPNVRNQ